MVTIFFVRARLKIQATVIYEVLDNWGLKVVYLVRIDHAWGPWQRILLHSIWNSHYMIRMLESCTGVFDNCVSKEIVVQNLLNIIYMRVCIHICYKYWTSLKKWVAQQTIPASTTGRILITAKQQAELIVLEPAASHPSGSRLRVPK